MELDVNFRKATTDDSRKIKHLVFSILEEYALKPDTGITDKDLDNIEGEYFSKGGYFGVVEWNDEIVASVGIYKISETTCELRKMYCSSKCRGKGLGKKLLEHSLTIAKELRFSHIVLETASPLIEAINLYKKYGFVEYQPRHLSTRCDQAYELYI